MRLRRFALSLRAQLLISVVVFVLGFVGLGLLATQRFMDGERRLQDAQLLAHATALAQGVEHEIRAIQGALIVLSNIGALQRGDLQALYGTAKRSATDLGDGIGFSLFTVDTNPFNTDLPFGTAIPFVAGPAAEALKSEHMMVADPFFSPALQRSIVIVSQPVRLGGEARPRYALNGFFPAERLQTIVRTAEVDEQWLVGIFDSKGAAIACSDEVEACERAAKRDAAERGQLKGRTQGMVISHPGLFEIDRLTAIVPIAETQWIAHVSRPADSRAAAFAGGPIRSLLLGGAAFLAVAIAGALLVSRRILVPLRELRKAAHTLGQSTRMVMPTAQRVPETRPIAKALRESHSRVRAASENLESRVAERTVQLEAQAEALREAQRHAEAANEGKTRFLARMSHELRTPLTAVLGLADLLLMDGLPPRASARLQLLKRSAGSLKELLDDALDFARIESGRLELRPVTFSPAAMAAEVVEMFRPLVSAKDCVITLELGTVPEHVSADANRIRQILVNLVANAVKFTASGTIAVHLDASDSGDRLVFRVRDSGIGIAPEAIERIFSPFEQGNPEQTNAVAGVGLGLAICRELVTAMGGSIGVRSEPGRGSTFHFDVPYAAPLAPAAMEEVRIVALKTPAPQPLRILLAEDNDVTREMIAAMLERDGHEVIAVPDGQAAVASALQDPFDVAILDYRMPVADGLEAARQLRASPKTRAMPLLALSADLFELRQKRHDAPFDAVFEKPIEWSVLQAALARIAEGTLPLGSADDASADEREGSPDAWDADALRAVRAGAEPQSFRIQIDALIKRIDAGLEAIEQKGVQQISVADEAHALAGLAAMFGWRAIAQCLRLLSREPDLAQRRTLLDRAIEICRNANVDEVLAASDPPHSREGIATERDSGG